MDIRRVVTGHDESGKSVFVSDETVAALPITGFHRLWGGGGLADFEAEVPGLLRYMDMSDPGMHTTDTIDFEVVLEGTVVLELDVGEEVVLNPGDTVVQNGTRHRWRNDGNTTARLAVFMCGAKHANVPPA